MPITSLKQNEEPPTNSTAASINFESRFYINPAVFTHPGYVCFFFGRLFVWLVGFFIRGMSVLVIPPMMIDGRQPRYIRMQMPLTVRGLSGARPLPRPLNVLREDGTCENPEKDKV